VTDSKCYYLSVSPSNLFAFVACTDGGNSYAKFLKFDLTTNLVVWYNKAPTGSIGMGVHAVSDTNAIFGFFTTADQLRFVWFN
jgi:hypothetical protein